MKNKKRNINKILIIIGIFLFLIGCLCIFIKANSLEYVDASGVLHESFYLLPIGFSFIFSGILILLLTGIVNLIKRKIS
ncbi:MAG: DUF3955 domain-containing protein [Bacilli bacterium]